MIGALVIRESVGTLTKRSVSCTKSQLTTFLLTTVPTTKSSRSPTFHGPTSLIVHQDLVVIDRHPMGFMVGIACG